MVLKSTDLQKSIKRQLAWAVDKAVDATWERFLNCVHVQFEHDDTVLFYDAAFYMKDPEDEFYWVFTEHHDYHVFSIDEVSSINELTRIYPK